MEKKKEIEFGEENYRMLTVGRKNHSLAAAKGYIVCTGGNYLRERMGKDGESEEETKFGYVTEVYMIEKNMWTLS